jgi:hypothetical protein
VIDRAERRSATMRDEAYRRQLEKLVAAMSRPGGEHGVALLADDSRPAVKMFVDGNLDKRLEKLAKQLEFVEKAFDNFEGLLVEYIHAKALSAFDTSASDGDRMLAWLADSRRLTPVQADYVTVQRTRHALENMAAAFREQHLAFQALRRRRDLSPMLLPTTVVRLNPIRAWARLETDALLDETAEPCELPCDVLLLADGSEIATVQLELEGQVLLNDLADNQPCSIGNWAELSRVSEVEELMELSRDLTALGLIAVAQ